MKTESTFYCIKKCIDSNFSIEEWNKRFIQLNQLGITEKEEVCKKQCEHCINILLNKKLNL